MKFTQIRFRWLSALICALFIALSGVISAQTGIYLPELRSIDSAVTRFMRDWNITGGAIAISKHGRLIYNRGFGFSDIDRTTAVRPDDQFRIASISKPLTSIAIMKLVDQGALTLDTLVFGENGVLQDPYYIDQIRDQRVYDITVRHLLEHTAGWDRKQPYGSYKHSDAPFFPMDVTAMFGEPNPVGDSTLIRFNLKKGLDFRPGTRFSYSNVGYLVLGKVIEKVAGISYERFVKQNVLEPAGAFDTHIGSSTEKLSREVEYIDRTLAVSCYGDGQIVPIQYGGFNLEAMNAHGGWVSTTTDLTRVLLSLDGTSMNSLLSAGSIETMTTGSRVNPNYAKGWSVNQKGNWWHTGSLDGTATFAARTSDGYTWVLLFNERADNSSEFWTALDRLPKAAIATVKVFPRVDLFESESFVSHVTSRYFEDVETADNNNEQPAAMIPGGDRLKNTRTFNTEAILPSRIVKAKKV